MITCEMAFALHPCAMYSAIAMWLCGMVPEIRCQGQCPRASPGVAGPAPQAWDLGLTPAPIAPSPLDPKVESPPVRAPHIHIEESCDHRWFVLLRRIGQGVKNKRVGIGGGAPTQHQHFVVGLWLPRQLSIPWQYQIGNQVIERPEAETKM